MRQETTSNITLPHCCNGCGAVNKTPQHVCSGCFAVHYCDKKCQKVHWKKHKTLCQAIKYLSNKEDKNCEDKCVFEGHVDPKTKQRVVELVGERCEVECQIGELSTKVLWDTGSQVNLLVRSG